MRSQIRFIAYLLLSIASEAPGFAAESTLDNHNVDQLLSTQSDPRAPGFAVLVRRDGKTLFEHGYGLRDLKSMTAIDADTNFRLASCSKQFTAMAIMLLVHDGKLRYDETLREVFPEFPEYGNSIAIRHLLNHSSGLLDYEALMDEVEKTSPGRWTAKRQIRDDEVLQLLEQQAHTSFAPGSRWEYSNSGYVVLGLVVAKASGKPFAEFLRERIFAPLGMRHTLAYIKGKNKIARRAFGHDRETGAWMQADQSSTSATLGDGGVYSSLHDLALWDAALTRHRLLSKAEMQIALTPVKFTNDVATTLPDDAPPSLRADSVQYGYGWFLDPYRGHARMWHYGDTRGFKSTIQRYTDDGLTIIVLANRTDLDPATIALQIADLVLP